MSNKNLHYIAAALEAVKELNDVAAMLDSRGFRVMEEFSVSVLAAFTRQEIVPIVTAIYEYSEALSDQVEESDFFYDEDENKVRAALANAFDAISEI